MIGVFDSGAGGLSVLKEIVKLLPGEKYVYFSDSGHCPYGEKSVEYIQERCRAIADLLIEKGADVIVVACNTATGAAIKVLREEYSAENSKRVLELTGGRRDHVMFIGMEPAVKPAALKSRSGVVGVLATAGTLKSSKYLTTKGKYKNAVKIVENVGKGYVELVERGVLSGEEAEKVVAESLLPLLEAGADTIVLGCTHYPFLLEPMRKLAGENVKIINPAPAVARRLVQVMKEEGLLKESAAMENKGMKQADIKLLASGDKRALDYIFSLTDV